MRAKVESLFRKQLDRITDPGLRKAAVDVWVDAATGGGWSPEDLEQIPFTLLANSHGINLIQHTRAVTEGALALAAAMQGEMPLPYSINMDWLVVGGLLHDVGKLLEYERVDGVIRKSRNGACLRHPVSGSIAAGKAGLPPEIINMIACHAREGDGAPKRIETVLI
ncbi:MAG: HDIG domain-containing metalloprotein, partial [Candidatus Fermentibacter daniensis]